MFAQEVAKGNEEAWEVVDEQAARVASLEAELSVLRTQLAELEPSERAPPEFKPRGSPRKTSEATREAIFADLAAGLSQSQAAVRNGVSAMTVSRLVRLG